MTPDSLAIRPGVAGIVFNDDGAILLHRRRVENAWAPPSGSMEPGENVRSALHRELHEETQLAVDVERLVGVYSDPAYQVVAYPDGRAVHFVTSVFACRVAGGRLRGSDEGIAWQWFDSSALPSNMPAYAQQWLDDGLAQRERPVVR